MTEAPTWALVVFPRFNPNSFQSLDAACAIQGAPLLMASNDDGCTMPKLPAVA